MSRLQQAAKALRGDFGEWFIDAVVLANVLMVGLEVDQAGEAGFQVPRIAFCLIYAVEMAVRILSDGLQSWKQAAVNLLDLLVVVMAVIDTARGQSTWLWRSTLLRALRFLRIYRAAARYRLLRDLWLVLVGLARAARGLAWLALLLVVLLFACSAAATGLVRSSVLSDEGAADCDVEQDFDCFNVQEYFGSVPRSLLTLLQLATLDSWASHVVRPLALSNPFAATVLAAFAVATAYGLLSVAVGMLVFSTVELARSHGDHASVKATREDDETIAMLTDYFKAILMMDQRATLDYVELQDAMSVPQVASALKGLDLPVLDIKELFAHLDKGRQGEITLEAFGSGLRLMKQPASRFDIACLSATIGGSVTFTGRLKARATAMHDRLEGLGQTLAAAFEEVEQVARHGHASEAPELHLRRTGRIECGRPPVTPRYS
mmetsp:Transcript_94178/g.304278  ORF Transcript_94178/g.304278 Transcript_94178/m.304278 type:complete len:434 (-) Transcript_94178:157-1458(-)